MDKLTQLLAWFDNKKNILVSLSGGVDSALVAYAAYKKLKKNAIAITADYMTLSKEELVSANHVAQEIGIKHHIIRYNELENENFTKNDQNRCFYCRDELSKKLLETAKRLNIAVIVDGTHTDDLGDYRPGITALQNNGILSPLIDTNFTKYDVRNVAKHVGLTIYDKPSNSCLASRIPWGKRVTAERLAKIEMAELMIKQTINVKQVRVRDLDGVAKIEVEQDSIRLLKNKKRITELTRKFNMIGFSSLFVDPDGYKTGKLNQLSKILE